MTKANTRRRRDSVSAGVCHSTPVEAIVSTEDLTVLEEGQTGRKGILAAIGLFADIPEWDEVIAAIVADRQTRTDRPVAID